MIEKIFTFFLYLSVGMFVFGLEEYFTANYPDKWYPGMSYRFFSLFPFLPLSDKSAKKLMYSGFNMFFITLILYAIFNSFFHTPAT